MFNYFQQTELDLIQRLKLCWFIIKSKSFRPVIKFSNGVEMDLSNRIITLNNPTEIYCKESLTISSEKHLMLNSGQVAEERPGYKYAIWLNSPLNTEGLPYQLVQLVNNKGELVYKEATYDSNGHLIIPQGHLLFDDNVESECLTDEEYNNLKNKSES
jgi:hypothetical protein